MMTLMGEQCRGCGAPTIERVVSLGPQPASDLFPLASDHSEDPRWPLELWLCSSCALVQLGPIEALLEEPPRAVESATSRAHAAASVAEILAQHPDLATGTVREFASHHGGSWLDHLAAAGCRLAPPDEPADFVVDVHAIAHEPAVGATLATRAAALGTDGLLLLEFHYLLALVRGAQFDTIRHGHWSYLSITALANLAGLVGLEVISVQPTEVFGGSVRVLLAHRAGSRTADDSVAAALAEESEAGMADAASLSRLQDVVEGCVEALRDFLITARGDGRSVLGYGAPSKAPVLLGVSGIDTDLLAFTVDAAPAKHGRRLPGSAITIRPVADLVAARPDVVLILTWDIAPEVIGQLEASGGWGAEYIVPLPAPHVVPYLAP
jgi:C-methyltransferase C-terminal domain/Putative zinc binding domain